MSNKLVYKKCFIDSNYRLPQSRSSSDFIIELNENVELPEGTRLHITDISIPAAWKTTEINFYEYMYVMIFDNSDVFVKKLQDLFRQQGYILQNSWHLTYMQE